MNKKELIERSIRRAQDINTSLNAMKPRDPEIPGGGFFLVIGKDCDISLPYELMQPFFEDLKDMNNQAIDKLLVEYENIDD